MKSILKYNWLIVLLVTTSLVVFAQDIEHHDYWDYYTFYLKNGEKIKVYEKRQGMVTTMFDKDINFIYDEKTETYTLTNEDGKVKVAQKDIDHYVFTRYNKGKLYDKHYYIIVPNQQKNYTSKTFDLRVLLKTEKYYLCAQPGYRNSTLLGAIGTYYYYIIDKGHNTVALVTKPKNAEEIFPEYFGAQTEFINCLEKNKYKINKCDDKLVFLAAWKYAHEYYKDSPFYEDKLLPCEKEIINQE